MITRLSLILAKLPYLKARNQGVDIVGSVESGIRSASWSPDDAFLILINGEDNLIQMTRDFDVIYESPLRTAEFGEGTYIYLPSAMCTYKSYIFPQTSKMHWDGVPSLHNFTVRSGNPRPQRQLVHHSPQSDQAQMMTVSRESHGAVTPRSFPFHLLNIPPTHPSVA